LGSTPDTRLQLPATPTAWKFSCKDQAPSHLAQPAQPARFDIDHRGTRSFQSHNAHGAVRQYFHQQMGRFIVPAIYHGPDIVFKQRCSISNKFSLSSGLSIFASSNEYAEFASLAGAVWESLRTANASSHLCQV